MWSIATLAGSAGSGARRGLEVWNSNIVYGCLGVAFSRIVAFLIYVFWLEMKDDVFHVAHRYNFDERGMNAIHLGQKLLFGCCDRNL